jgi:CAAX protease family protein
VFRVNLLWFFALTFVVTWTCYFGASRFPGAVARIIVYAGVFAPGIVALLLTAREKGRPGVEELLRRVTYWRVAARWYVFAITYMAAIKLTAAVLHLFVTGQWPRFGQESWLIILVAIPISAIFQAGEEIGWRGYALPRLMIRVGFAAGSIILGILWAFWHLPLFFILAGDTRGQSFPLYALQVTALSVAISWLYVRTSGSLLLVMLMHSAVNQTKDIVPSAVSGATDPFALSRSLIGWLTAGLLWLCAAYFLFTTRGRTQISAAPRSMHPTR